MRTETSEMESYLPQKERAHLDCKAVLMENGSIRVMVDLSYGMRHLTGSRATQRQIGRELGYNILRHCNNLWNGKQEEN